MLFPEGPLKQQWTVCLEKLLLYLKSSLYNQVKIYRSDLAAERNCLGNGRVFPDTGWGRTEMVATWVTQIGIWYWVIHWFNASLQNEDPLFLRALKNIKRTIPTHKHNKVQRILLYIKVHKSLCGVYRCAIAAMISTLRPKDDEMCLLLLKCSKFTHHLGSFPIFPYLLTQPGC